MITHNPHLQKLLHTFGISILLQPIVSVKCMELHIHNVHWAVALLVCGMIHDVTVTSSLHHQP